MILWFCGHTFWDWFLFAWWGWLARGSCRGCLGASLGGVPPAARLFGAAVVFILSWGSYPFPQYPSTLYSRNTLSCSCPGPSWCPSIFWQDFRAAAISEHSLCLGCSFSSGFCRFGPGLQMWCMSLCLRWTAESFPDSYLDYQQSIVCFPDYLGLFANTTLN